MTLLYIPGESTDQIAVYIPSMNAVAVADLVYKMFPNLFSIRGSKPRPIDGWFQSVDKACAIFCALLFKFKIRNGLTEK